MFVFILKCHCGLFLENKNAISFIQYKCTEHLLRVSYCGTSWGFRMVSTTAIANRNYGRSCFHEVQEVSTSTPAPLGAVHLGTMVALTPVGSYKVL